MKRIYVKSAPSLERVVISDRGEGQKWDKWPWQLPPMTIDYEYRKGEAPRIDDYNAQEQHAQYPKKTRKAAKTLDPTQKQTPAPMSVIYPILNPNFNIKNKSDIPDAPPIRRWREKRKEVKVYSSWTVQGSTFHSVSTSYGWQSPWIANKWINNHGCLSIENWKTVS